MIYVFKKGEQVVWHTSLDAAKEMDGVTQPDTTVSESDFYAAGGLIRLIDGEIVIGKTDAEKLAEAQQTVRDKRNRLLEKTVDPMQKVLVWNSMSEEEQKKWTAYRQALLDVPEQKIFKTKPEKVVWPDIPE
ncbi:MAG: phage tail assembly chaperone [Oscillospiraceae bacterium]|jgi:exonuclease I